MNVSRALALSLFALAVPAAPAAAACDVTVSLPNFSPATHSVPAGGTVTWCWSGDNHSVTGDFDDSDVRNTGATFTHTFAVAGNYAYHCVNHTSMQGTIVVTQASTGPTPTTTPTTKPKTSAPTAPPTTAPPTTRPATTPPVVTRTPTPSSTPSATPTATTAAPTTAAITSPPASPTTSPAALDIDPEPAKPKTGLAIALGLVVAAGALGGAGWLLLRGRSG